MWVCVVWLVVRDCEMRSHSCVAELEQVTGPKGQKWISFTLCYRKCGSYW